MEVRLTLHRPREPSSGCEPSYPDVCLRSGIGDYDCANGTGDGPNYVPGPVKVDWTVPNPDPFGLGADQNGTGCENG